MSDKVVGGMIALGLGAHNWSAEKCVETYKTLIQNGLQANLLTKSWFFGWIARFFRESIYSTPALEEALKAAYGQNQELFSLEPTTHNHITRVAVTTTVETGRKIIANYRRGGSEEYLDSTMLTWEA